MLSAQSFLVLEPDAINALLMRTILEKHGAQATVVSTVEQAERELNSRVFDALIMETLFIQGEPLSFLRRVRQSPVSAGTRLIVITSDQTFHDKFATHPSLDLCILKPINIDTTIREIAMLLASREKSQGVRPPGARTMRAKQLLSMN